MKIHIVQKGDTLWKIAKKYGVNFEELKKMNAQLSNPDMIMPGMKIKVPTSGGTVKKEAKSGQTPINYGSMKEMPKAKHPFAQQKPAQMPVAKPKEMPVAPVKEQPKEMPKKQYAPKMPQPVIPEIDINNYYMMNMANMQTQQQKPKMPKKPTNVLPSVKGKKKEEVKGVKKEEVKPIKKEAKKEEELEMPQMPIYQQPMMPADQCYPVSPIMPGPGFCPPHGMYGGHPMHGGGFPGQVQGASMMPQMHGQTPMMPYMGFDDESSEMMPSKPSQHMMSPMHQQGAVQGIQDNPYPTVQMPNGGMPYGQMPQQMPYGQMPFGDNCYPASPVMPGSGFHNHGGYPDQVQGAMTDEYPEGVPYGQMPVHQMPMHQAPMHQDDCGCGPAPQPYGMQHGGMPFGGMGPNGFGMPQGGMNSFGNPGMQGMPQGMDQGMQGMDQGMQGMPQGMQGMDQGMQGMDQGMQGIPQGLQGMGPDMQGMQGMPQGMQGMDQGMQGMPQGMQGMPQGMQGGPQFFPQQGPGMFGPRAFGMPSFHDDDSEG
ncbi:SafA/ExsA family spore coat assembly protein [Rossellomorea sp. BNER]|uniref:SafA/ExsA family spore coat assembly protein n=1 Tax=Rossellomorea sp. BNER TaxID=2962031 RepID=UPI003AF2FE10|nr:SafA/ExsA family spore coat assembly protein [Rossellomorea sp. BNER]